MKNYFEEVDFKKIMDLVQIPVIVFDCHGNTLFANRKWQDFKMVLSQTELQQIEITVSDFISSEKTEKDFLKYILTSNKITIFGERVFVVQAIFNEDKAELIEKLNDAAKINESFQEKLFTSGENNYITASGKMIDIFAKAKQVAAYPTSIMLLGETGVGKEVLSSFIHNNSERAGKPFIKINCSAIPEPLMESELFGYESGAFTGARDKGKSGLFELANHGTILLDEIGDMALPMQTKLLRVIQEGEIVRVGGSKSIALDVRIISATSRDLEKRIEEGLFIDALFYRLNVVEIRIPPLRERVEDILPLAEYYLQFFCEKYNLQRRMSKKAKQCFLQHKWPGNVRELRNIVENLAVSTNSQEIGLEDLPLKMINGTVYDTNEVNNPTRGETMKDAVEHLQKEMISRALNSCGSMRKAAVLLDMDPATLHRLAKKLNINIQ